MRRSTINKIKSFLMVLIGAAVLGLSVSILQPKPMDELKKIERQKEIIKESLTPAMKKKIKDKDIDKLIKKYEDLKRR